MPRIVRTPPDRRRELVDIALRLFLAKGYDATAVSEVIAAAGLSKGAFYHHFATKDDLLEAIALRLVEESLCAIAPVLDDRSLNAFERLDAYLAHSSNWKRQQGGRVMTAFTAIFRPENLLLYHRIHLTVLRKVSPVLARIIGEGLADRVFDTPDAEAAAEMLLLLSATTHDAVARLVTSDTEHDRDNAAVALEKRLKVVGIAADRLLGLPDGSIRFAEEGFAQAFAAMLPPLPPSDGADIVPLRRAGR
jgi:AcrR family transcriptional regulator